MTISILILLMMWIAAVCWMAHRTYAEIRHEKDYVAASLIGATMLFLGSPLVATFVATVAF
jgi:hypothetical protein